MSETISRLLLRLSEAGSDGLLIGSEARAHRGPVFDSLVRRGVLCEEAPLSEWALCAGCECGLPWRQIAADGDQYRARCPLDRSRDVVLEADDFRLFSLDPVALARFISAAAGLDGHAEEISAGIWRLGRLSSRRDLVVCFERRVLEQPHLPSVLAAREQPVVTLLGPRPAPRVRESLHTAGVDCVDIESVVSTDADQTIVLNRTRLDIDGPARLVLDMPRVRVVIDGIAQSVSAQPFRLLGLLVSAALDGKGSVSTFVIVEQFGREPNDLVRNLRDALSKGRDNATEIRGWIVAVRSQSAFRIALPAEQIEVLR
ncbi:MAG: hypothetical protein KDA73_19695 [Rhodobacteraceae bacterium]|nr:hypothetical protein [Paracoccaceae bacterium]